MTVVLTLGWIRSQFATDVFRVTTSEHHTNGIMSDHGLLAWTTFHHPHLVFPFPELPAWIATQEDPSTTLRDIMETPLMQWSWQFKGFGSGKVKNRNGSTFGLFVVPYWFVTLPTALAAYLLLSGWVEDRQVPTTDELEQELLD